LAKGYSEKGIESAACREYGLSKSPAATVRAEFLSSADIAPEVIKIVTMACRGVVKGRRVAKETARALVFDCEPFQIFGFIRRIIQNIS